MRSRRSGLQRVHDVVPRRRAAVIVDVDRVKAQTLGVPVDQVFSALGGYLGSSYVDAVQQVRPHVPGLRAGRFAVPPAPEDIDQLYGAQQQGRHGAARHAGDDHADGRPVADQPLQSLSVRDDHRPAGARASRRARRSR